MPLNKFGIPLKSDKNTIAFLKQSSEARNREYIQNNALCLISLNDDDDNCYNAKSCKISRLASPDLDTDATNKYYVDVNIQNSLEHCNSKIEDLKVQHNTEIENLKSLVNSLKSELEVFKGLVGQLFASHVGKKKLVNELHAPARRNYPRRRVIVRGFDDLWQADIVEMRPYARTNQGYHYILTIIDVLSKYAWAVPLKNKSGAEVAKQLVKIFKDYSRHPKNLQTDQGKEFYNADVGKVMKKYNINHYSTYSVMKASVVERFNRTLKNEMWKLFTLNGNYKWINILSQLISDYNMRKHRTIKMRPNDVTPEIAEELLSTVYSNVKIAAPGKFRVGDQVRISKFKTIFAKGYTPNWTTEVFKIIKVQVTNPVTYLLEDSQGKPIAGGFYEYELQRTANPDVYLVEKILRNKNNKVYVKWLGFDASHNSWIDKNMLLSQ